MKKLFQYSEENPYHISVGAVLVKDGKILLHRHVRAEMPEKYRKFLDDLETAYTLMRESLENGESLEEAVLRGIKEEFGAEGTIVRYLGSIDAALPKFGIRQKTTLYFEVTCTALGERSPQDEEANSKLEWYTPDEAFALLTAQEQVTDRGDLHEAPIVENYRAFHP